jgi:ABC-type molybdate transport system permease subunit
MPLAIYEAVVAGEDWQTQILALMLTEVSVITIYLTNKLQVVERRECNW